MLLKDKTAVITGCNRGIGKATLEAFVKNGSNVFAVIRKKNEEFSLYCQELAKQYGVQIELFYADFSSEDEVQNVAREIVKRKMPIDVLVNNIAVSSEARMFTMTKMEQIKDLYQVNVFSSLLFTQLIGRSMIRSAKGSIVFVSSTAIYDAWSNVDYTSSKAAIVGATRRLAIEMGNYHIRVNAVAPTLTNTDMALTMNEEDTRMVTNRNIMKRKGEPDEVADVIVFLASEMSRFMTGQVLRVDGGMLG